MTDSDGNRVLNPSEFEQLQDSIDGTGQIRGRSSGSRSSGSAVSRLHRSRTAANVDDPSSNTAPPLVEQLLQAFDGDRNGKLSQREVQQMFTQHGMPFSVADDAFRASDSNGDWELDASEMVNFYHRAQASVSNYASSQRFGQQKQQAIEQRRFQQVQQGQPQRKPFQSRNQPLN
uniref:EF-hand domain-containing protein n=1 Tax=Plectus sambesii TaxID=2011161 RepID=A0A914W5D1_9BILA